MEYTKNDIVTVEIEDMGIDGEGIGKLDGYPFFVKDAIIGDKADIRITKVKKNYGYAKLEKVITPSPFRVEPACRFYRQCGGCQLQAMNYNNQLMFKQGMVINNLVRIGGFDSSLIEGITEPAVGMEEPFRYRNKAQYPVGTDKEGNPVTGFYAGRTHTIIPNTDCLLGAAENKEILEVILSYMKNYKVSAYDETTGRGLIRHILIRTGFTSKEIMVCLVINLKKKEERKEFLPKQKELLEALCAIKNMTSVSVSINTELTNVIMGQEIHTIWGTDRIHDTIHMRDTNNNFAKADEGITFSISPLSFYQVNPVQTEKLYSLALEFAQLTGKETVWDLYCGIGTISLFLAKRARMVYGVEIVPQAIEDAKQNAEANGIYNVEFYTGRAEEVLPEKYKAEGIYADVIVVDPPRKGCDQECLDTMLKMTPQRIVYVSCDSATLARDLKVLCEADYEMKRFRVIDQFCGTVHVESVVLMSRQKA